MGISVATLRNWEQGRRSPEGPARVLLRVAAKHADQYLCAALLRPGNAPTSTGALGMLQALVALVRAAFPHTTIRVRLDGGFAPPDLLE